MNEVNCVVRTISLLKTCEQRYIGDLRQHGKQSTALLRSYSGVPSTSECVALKGWSQYNDRIGLKRSQSDSQKV